MIAPALPPHSQPDVPGPATDGATAPAGSERRTFERHVWDPYRSLSVLVGADGWPALVQDLSRGGVSLLVGEHPDQGADLPITLRRLGCCCQRTLRLTYVAEIAPGCWLTGGAFDHPLDDADLEQLLR